jgi:branched-chain amino acid transport system substrate-binding protein
MLRKANTTDTEKMVDAMEGLKFTSPFGPVEFRKIDHQATLGAFVGKTKVQGGKGIMVDWRYADGKDYLPSDAEVNAMRPKDA